MTSPARPLRVAFRSLGCRVNAAEVGCLRSRFAGEGWRPVPFDGEADLYVINTCTVTALADADARQEIRRAARRKPAGAIVAVTGCYAQRDPDALERLAGVDLVLGNTEKAELFEHVRRRRADGRLAGDVRVDASPRTHRFLPHGAGMPGRTRATLKVQDGCDERCTYCIIPQVRGPAVSRDLTEIREEAQRLAAQGYREIALTGVNTGSWGRERGERDGLAWLVVELESLRLPLRYRLNSLEPGSVTAALLDAIAACPSFAPHFHVPLQHGDSRVLRRMGRTYDAAFYAQVIAAIHARFPHAGIGADVMVGFPGETEDEFATMQAFVARLPLSYLHVFSYSPRSSTAAARMPDPVAPAMRRARRRAMDEIDHSLRARFVARLAGREEEVLVEAKIGAHGFATGLTGNYLRVEMSDIGPRANELWRVRIAPGTKPTLARATPIGQVGVRRTQP